MQSLNLRRRNFKKLQSEHKDLQRSNKRLSSVIAGNGTQIQKRQDLSEVFRQQRWARKKTNAYRDITVLEDEGVHVKTIALAHNSINETASLNMESGEYSKAKK